MALPWINPFAPGPSPPVVPLLVSGFCTAGLMVLYRHLSVKTIVIAWVAAALVSATLGLLQYFAVHDWLGSWVNHAGRGHAFGNLRQRNQFASLMVIGLAGLIWWVRTTGAATHAGAAAVLLAVATAASASRTGLSAWLGVSLLAIFWTHGPQRTRLFFFLLMGSSAFGIAALGLPLLIGEDPLTHGLLARLDPMGQGCLNRATLWGNVVHLIGSRPWAGWGLGELDFAHYATLYPGQRFCDILDNAHNLPLHLAVEFGVPAAVVLCGLALGWAARQRPWAERDPSRQLAWMVLAIIAWHSLLEYPLWYGPFQMALGLCMYMLHQQRPPPGAAPLASTPSRAPTSTSRPDKDRVLGSAVTKWPLFAIVLILFCCYSAWDYRRISQIYLRPDDRAPAYRHDTLALTQSAWLFRNQWDFAALTTTELTAENASETLERAQRLLHYSPEARVIERVIDASLLLGQTDQARWHEVRFAAAFPKAHAEWLSRHAAAVAPPAPLGAASGLR